MDQENRSMNRYEYSKDRCDIDSILQIKLIAPRIDDKPLICNEKNSKSIEL